MLIGPDAACDEAPDGFLVAPLVIPLLPPETGPGPPPEGPPNIPEDEGLAIVTCVVGAFPFVDM